MNIAIIDYNMGNLASLKNSFNKIGHTIDVVTDSTKIRYYDKLILPGVGAFGDAMNHLNESGMREAINEFIKSGRYLLGICLGMQLLFRSSSEFGISSGFGIFDDDIIEFENGLRVPQMGWNRLTTTNSLLFDGLPKEFYLYFVHSYYAPYREKYTIAKTDYGHQYSSAVNIDNVFGIQPHPEKSHDIGLQILKNFVKL